MRLQAKSSLDDRVRPVSHSIVCVLRFDGICQENSIRIGAKKAISVNWSHCVCAAKVKETNGILTKEITTRIHSFIGWLCTTVCLSPNGWVMWCCVRWSVAASPRLSHYSKTNHSRWDARKIRFSKNISLICLNRTNRRLIKIWRVFWPAMVLTSWL